MAERKKKERGLTILLGDEDGQVKYFIPEKNINARNRAQWNEMMELLKKMLAVEGARDG